MPNMYWRTAIRKGLKIRKTRSGFIAGGNNRLFWYGTEKNTAQTTLSQKARSPGTSRQRARAWRSKPSPSAATGKIRRGGKTYTLVDAYPSRQGLKRIARDLRTPFGGLYSPEQNRTMVRTHDMGKNAGRLRYGVFVRRGRAFRKATILKEAARLENLKRGPTVAFWKKRLKGHR